ncbi:MAG: sigma-70 family RNA polymerase sigma factor [Acidobacteria bacterium]|jgi:RNA polymerase sigma-70 factor (ECF subfamily)|nr:sigma-70 family RNA polymerase sigma factor [Acidobacteriota bacterium]MCU0254994.1 sigma-70 family RNA polymerase sigma factor [Acidobacteriota bacterium]
MSPAPSSAAPERPGLGPQDFALIRAVQSGDPAAFERFVDRFGPMIMAFGLRMCGNRADAEDVFQETLIKVYTRLADLDEPGALRTWFWRVVSNECLMSRRGPRDPGRTVTFDEMFPLSAERGEAPDLPDAGAVDPERAVLAAEVRERIEAAIRILPPDYRIILLLRDFEQLSTEEVAAVLQISEANAKVRLHRARAALRRLLHAEGGTAG